MLTTMVGQRLKIEKKTKKKKPWLKRPKAVPQKTTFELKYK